MQKIGTVASVQIQRQPLKQIQNPNNTYDDRIYCPQWIERVETLQLTPQGIIGIDAQGNHIIDVHNETHPQTRFRGGNKLSFGFLDQYDRMREQFDTHIKDGDAGENILLTPQIDSATFAPAGQRLFFKRDEAHIEITQVIPAPPCRPFSVYCANKDIHGKELKSALQFLDNGTRGYYAELLSEGAHLTIKAGDTLWMV